MTDNFVVLISVVSKAVATVAAIAGVVFLAYNDKPGWGWLIVVAIVLGSFTVRTTPDEPVPVKEKQE